MNTDPAMPGRPLRALFINENIGGHVTVHHHLRRLMAERDDVDATFLDVHQGGLLRRLLSARVPGLARLDLDLQPLRAQLAQSWWVDRRVRSAIDDVDVVHLYTHNAGLLSTRHWRRVPTVVTLDTTNQQNAYRLPTRDPTRFTPLTVFATKPFERRVYDAAARIVANSQWTADSLRRDYGIDDDRLRVIPFGVAIPRTTHVAASSPAAQRPRIVFVGRKLRRKGGEVLLDVFRRSLHTEAELVLITEDLVDASPGVRVINDISPGDPRLWDELRAASIFAFPSEIDMAPNAVMEAMAAGLPVVARGVGAIPEMVDDGVTGVLVDAGAEALERALLDLLRDHERCRRMGAAARRRAESHFDMSIAADSLVDVLREAANCGDVPPTGRSNRTSGAGG